MMMTIPTSRSSAVIASSLRQHHRYYSPLVGTAVCNNNLALPSSYSYFSSSSSSSSSTTTPPTATRTRRSLLSSYSTTTSTSNRSTTYYDASLMNHHHHQLFTPNTANNIITTTITRSYITRAHQPKRGQPTKDELSVRDAIQQLIKDSQQRRKRRVRKWKRNNNKKRDASSAGEEATGTCNHPDEMVELVLNLNLDPRKPGQALRGTVSLPHGTGKSSNDCIVFTNDTAVAEAALKAGAIHSGGESLMDSIVDGSIPLDYNTLGSTIATNDMMQALSKKGLARILGPRGLMPNVKIGTLVNQPNQLLDVLSTKSTGSEINYRTEKEGIVHCPVGKVSFGPTKILENIGEIMKEIYKVRPENYGKGKKKSSNPNKKGGSGSKPKTKYLLRASASTTQGKGLRLDLRTIDPSSAFFLTSADDDDENDNDNEGDEQQQAA